MVASINASTSAGVVTTADTSGVLALQTAGTTALSISASQVVTLTNALPVASGGSGVTTSTGTGANVLGTSPTITTPTISSLSSASATALTLQSAGTTAVTIDTSQNVGIGTSSPLAKLHVSTASASAAVLILNSTNNTPYMRFDESGGSKFIIGESSIVGGGGAGYYDFYVGASVGQRFFTGAAERMRIDSSGRVCIGVSSAAYSTACAMNVNVDTVSAGGGAWVSKCTGTGTVFHLNFQNGNGGVGGISTSASATQYVTSSDYRLKENIAPMTGALAKVALLKPVTYKWKVDGSNGEGFIAHELAEVVEGCVTGEKDAVDADGNPKYQGIDTSFLVATLTAAIQELKAINDTQAETINALTARIVALETV